MRNAATSSKASLNCQGMNSARPKDLVNMVPILRDAIRSYVSAYEHVVRSYVSACTYDYVFKGGSKYRPLQKPLFKNINMLTE